MVYSTLFIPISITICFLDSFLVIISILGLFFWVSFMIFWISEILLGESLGKASLILKKFLMLFLRLGHKTDFLVWKFVLVFLKNFDLARTLLLGLKGIGRGILETSAYLPFTELLEIVVLAGILLNCAVTYCLNDLLFLFITNLS